MLLLQQRLGCARAREACIVGHKLPVTTPTTAGSCSRSRRPCLCRAKDSQFESLYTEFSIMAKEDARPLPNEALFDILYEVSSADDAAQVLELLQEDAKKRENKLQGDWPFRKKLYALLVEKAVENKAFKVVAQLLDSTDSITTEKYFIKELIKQLSIKEAPLDILEKLVEIQRIRTKGNPALKKGLRGAYYEFLWTCKSRGLVDKEMQFYQAAKADGVTFSEGYTKKMERGSKAPMVTIPA